MRTDDLAGVNPLAFSFVSSRWQVSIWQTAKRCGLSSIFLFLSLSWFLSGSDKGKLADKSSQAEHHAQM